MLVHVGTVFLLIAASGLLKLVMFSWFNYCVDRSVIFTYLMLQKFAHSVFEGFVHCFEQIQLRTFNKQIPAVLF